QRADFMPACGIGSARLRRRVRSWRWSTTKSSRPTATRRRWRNLISPSTRSSPARRSSAPTRRNKHVYPWLDPLPAGAGPPRRPGLHGCFRAGGLVVVLALAATRLAWPLGDALVRLFFSRPRARDAAARWHRRCSRRRAGEPRHRRDAAEGARIGRAAAAAGEIGRASCRGRVERWVG